MDWSGCPLVGTNPLKLGGVPILNHTRLQAGSLVGNYETGLPVEEIAYQFDVREDIVREVLAYAARQRTLVIAA